jgi:hypothetical protein
MANVKQGFCSSTRRFARLMAERSMCGVSRSV